MLCRDFLELNATQNPSIFHTPRVALMVAAPLRATCLSVKVKPSHSFVIFVSTFFAGIGMFTASPLYFVTYNSARASFRSVFLAFALGFGMANVPILLLSSCPKDDIGEASAILALVRKVSGAFRCRYFSTILDNNTTGMFSVFAKQPWLGRTGASSEKRLHSSRICMAWKDSCEALLKLMIARRRAELPSMKTLIRI